LIRWPCQLAGGARKKIPLEDPKLRERWEPMRAGWALLETISSPADPGLI